MSPAKRSHGGQRVGSVAIEAKGLVKRFKTGRTYIEVLKGIDFDARHGDLTMVMGPSGSGKSTLVAALSGLLEPNEGRVSALEAPDLWAMSSGRIDKFRLDHCGFIFQGFNLFSALTASQQVQIVLKYLKVKQPERKKRADAALADVNLGHRLDNRPDRLSGGEKQRVAIARALAKRPKLIFADEPTSALDGENGHVVMELLRKCAKEQGATVLCVTHDARLAAFADRIITIEDGRITSTNADPSQFVH